MSLTAHYGTPAAPLPLTVVGCDFRIASSALREMLLTNKSIRRELVKAIRNIDASAGLVVLETCNRMEWIVSSDSPHWMADLLQAQIIDRWSKRLPPGRTPPNPYIHCSEEAFQHVFRVVIGQESLATGEAQIAGQFQQAFEQARQEGTSNIILNGLSSFAGRIAKSAYKIGYRSNARTGVHGLVLTYIKKKLGDPKGKTILLAGMGSIGRKTASLLEQSGCRVTPFNRSISDKHSGTWLPLSDLPAKIMDAHAVVVATGAFTPVFQINSYWESTRESPLPVMDIGVPSQVDPEIADLPHIDYRTIDALEEVSQTDLSVQCTEKLEQEITRETTRFRQFCQARNIVTLLDTIHQKRNEYIQKHIPVNIHDHFSEWDETIRKKTEKVMQQLIREYANDLFSTIHTALEDFRNAS
jgi:glutamyl-tRNA reductase